MILIDANENESGPGTPSRIVIRKLVVTDGIYRLAPRTALEQVIVR